LSEATKSVTISQSKLAELNDKYRITARKFEQTAKNLSATTSNTERFKAAPTTPRIATSE